MYGKTFFVAAAVFTSVFVESWHLDESRANRETRRGSEIHYHTKRHMLPSETDNKRRPQRERDQRKKPSGHLAPLQEDDMDNDEVVSVAIGPPPMRPKYDKLNWKHVKTTSSPPVEYNNVTYSASTNIVKDILMQLGRELLTKDVSEDFAFGQYVGSAMRNMTGELKLKMQHEILEVVMRYQKSSRDTSTTIAPKVESASAGLGKKNDTDEAWPDFSNLAKYVG